MFEDKLKVVGEHIADHNALIQKVVETNDPGTVCDELGKLFQCLEEIGPLVATMALINDLRQAGEIGQLNAGTPAPLMEMDAANAVSEAIRHLNG